MTERTERATETLLKTLREIHSKLKAMPQAALPTPIETQYANQSFSKLLKALDAPAANPSVHELAIFSISEAFRIVNQPFSTSSLFSDAEIHKIFSTLLSILSLKSHPLSRLIQSGLPALLHNVQLIQQFISVYPTLTYNKNGTAELISVFIDISSDKQKLINSVFATHNLLLIKKVCNVIGIDKIDNSNYLFLYMNWIGTEEYSGPKIPFRHVTLENITESKQSGVKRARISSKLSNLTRLTEYVKRAITIDTKDAFMAYAQNENYRLRLEAVPDQATSKKAVMKLREYIHSDEIVRSLFEELMDDPEEMVRYRATCLLDWNMLESILQVGPTEEECSFRKEYRVFLERVIDKSERIRKVILGVIEEGMKHKGEVSERVNNQNIVRFLEECVVYLLKGCLTEAKSECIEVLRRYPPSLEFLYKSRYLSGVVEFTRTLKIDEEMYSHIRDGSVEVIDFILSNCESGALNKQRVEELLQRGFYQVLRHIKKPECHLKTLARIVEAADDTAIVEQAAELIRAFMQKDFIYNKENLLDKTNKIEEDKNIKDEISINTGECRLFEESTYSLISKPENVEEWPANLFFIAAHVPDEVLNGQCIPEGALSWLFERHTYPMLFFLSWKVPEDSRFPEAVIQAEISDDQRIGLIQRTAVNETLCKYVDVLLRMCPSESALRTLVSSKSMLTAQIYFVITGRVQIQNPGFFLSCVKLLAHATPQKKISTIIKRYMTVVPAEVYNLFYTLANGLRSYSLNSLQVAETNKMIDYLIEEITTVREGKLVEYSYDFEKEGFVIRKC